MVRLKESCIASPVMPPCYFNSTMVRLKVSLRHCEYNYYKFQFHYGTIKRELAASTIQKVYNFNSTMVRLKADSLEMWYICKIFQFHYGTIKRMQLLSNAVKLQLFQFHYGTIKSLTLEKISVLIFKNLANTKL